ncbi:hypothetical protein DFH08DRAFT_1087173 [Mycena albidolilacea]|uniref:Mug135-like C-terminal domain-containing protein n=1 Tax=Mycena albidolilacea TaxID=1033008 RepID=A0AAD7EDQ4_9AGAR|nr:hypothetical protein DFH08DRAFT_1087173 [Mycena albidolilacea]
MAGVAMILNAIAASNQALNGRLNDLQREIAINGNITKGTGLKIPHAEALFLDGTRPTAPVAAVPAQAEQVAQLGRPALPLINNVAALRALQGPEATHYLTGYGVAPIPHLVQQRQVLIAECIGCVIDI